MPYCFILVYSEKSFKRISDILYITKCFFYNFEFFNNIVYWVLLTFGTNDGPCHTKPRSLWDTQCLGTCVTNEILEREKMRKILYSATK